VDDADFGRIAAQTAKQVIIQKIREAERRSIYDEFSKKQGELISGTVHRFEKKAIIVELGKTEGILPAREQSPKEEFGQGDFIRSFILEVKRAPSGPEIILSRACEGLVKRLFEIEVPEIHDKIVEVRGLAREAGSRTKIAVHSSDTRIDPVGSCVGVRGQRVKNIVRELRGEKIDIIRWSDNLEAYMRESLKPAIITEIKMNREAKAAEVFVADDQLSLAIGKKGQNVRLASKLLGWRLDVRSVTQKVPISALEGVGPKVLEALATAKIASIKDILRSTPEELMKIKGIGPKTAEKIFRLAHEVILKEKKPGAITPAQTEAGTAPKEVSETEVKGSEEQSGEASSHEGA
jgi:N utilization substance protein A